MFLVTRKIQSLKICHKKILVTRNVKSQNFFNKIFFDRQKNFGQKKMSVKKKILVTKIF